MRECFCVYLPRGPLCASSFERATSAQGEVYAKTRRAASKGPCKRCDQGSIFKPDLQDGFCMAECPLCAPVDSGEWRQEDGSLAAGVLPVPVSLIFLGYLCVVWAGPGLMKHRQPVDLKVVLIVYNFAMVGLSAYMFHEFLVASWLSRYSLLCQPVDYSTSPLAMRMARVCWWFFFSKVIELSDTLFFILRKKNSQLTFLHVYHHGTMIFNWWAGVKYVAGGQSFFIGLVNTFVHIIMYSYYGLAAIGPHMQKYLWWKRYLTSLQLVQFLLFLLHTGYNLFTECDFPDSMNIVVFGYCVTLIFLFSNFYYQSYLHKKKQK